VVVRTGVAQEHKDTNSGLQISSARALRVRGKSLDKSSTEWFLPSLFPQQLDYRGLQLSTEPNQVCGPHLFIATSVDNGCITRMPHFVNRENGRFTSVSLPQRDCNLHGREVNLSTPPEPAMNGL
jgi:hypothetical protein